jgi:AcrR family transcriptional regulator
MRAAAIAEIKGIARGLLVEGGPSAVSLRAIARAMGLTPTAMYRYFPSLDALIAALGDDLRDELRRCIESARDEMPGDDPLQRVSQMARAFRAWALGHPAEFGLLFGPRWPGVPQAQADSAKPPDPDFGFGAPFLAEFWSLWKLRPIQTPPVGLIEERLGRHLGPYAVTFGQDIPLPVMFIFLSAWTRLFGMVAMEVFGHMKWAFADPEVLFEMELLNFAKQLTGD